MGYFEDRLFACTSNRLIKRLLTPGDRLSERVVHAGFWAFALRIADRSFGLIRTIVLARLLAPEDFGLFGIAMLALTALETFSETGFNAALIQRPGDIRPYLDTAWTVQAIRGFLLAAILLLIAPFVAEFFGEPGAEPLMQALALYQVLSGLVNTGVLYFRKELEFHKEFIYMFSGTLVNFLVAIPAALILRNAWALVFGYIAGQLIRLVVSYLVHPYRPRLNLNRTFAKEIFGFGRWVLGSSMLVFLINNGDNIIVGRLLGAISLGLYLMAYTIANTPATEISNVVSQVAFPAYSKLQNSIDNLKNGYLKVLQISTFISIPIAGLIFVLAPEFTLIFLGEKWTPIVPVMQLLVLSGLMRSIAAISGFLFYSIGRPEIDTKLQILRLIIILALVYPFTIEWGITGTAIAVFLSNFIAGIGFCLMIIKTIKLNIMAYITTIMIPLSVELIAILSLLVLKTMSGIGIKEFVLHSLILISIYLIGLYFLSKLINYDIYALVNEIVRSLRGG